MPEPERTDDGRYLVIGGRRWRAGDPSLPEGERERLVAHLMAARRAVGAALRSGDPEAERSARTRVGWAKEGLGERGTPWWELPGDERRLRWEAALRRLDAPASPDVASGETGA